MSLSIWQALDKYKETGKDIDWSSTAISVDTKTDRMVMYYLGDKSVVADMKAKKRSDGSCDVQAVLGRVDDLLMVFIMNNRNGVLDVYRCDGIFEEIPLPFPVHMDRFVEAMVDFLRYQDTDVKDPQPWNIALAGGASGSDAGVDGRGQRVEVISGYTNEDSKRSKYTAATERKSAMRSFEESETFRSRRGKKKPTDLTDFVPREPGLVAYRDEDIEKILDEVVEIDAPRSKKPRTLGIIGLISSLMDRMRGSDER
jgi:hypothetical protein